MSQEPKPVPPFMPAELTFTSAIPEEYKDRWFIAQDPEKVGGSWWLGSDDEGGNGYTEQRDDAGLFNYRTCHKWPGRYTHVEMLPLAVQAPKVCILDRDITYADLGKVGAARYCLMKNKDGEYLDGNLQKVALEVCEPQKCSALYGLEVAKGLAFELLLPFDADTGGPETQEVVCYAEAQRQDDSKRFLVKLSPPDAVTGYGYFSSLTTARVSRSGATLYSKKELQRHFDSVPKATITIELLTPQPISKLEDFFNASGLALIKASPNNELVRGFMLSKLKVMPPKGEDTFDKLKKWIEWNVGKPGSKKPEPVAQPEPPQTVANIELTLNIERTRTAIGHCNFTVAESGRDSADLSLADLADLAADSSNWNSFRRAVMEFIINNSDDNADYGDEGERELSDFETTDSTNHEARFESNTEASEALTAFMRAHLPDALARLNPPPAAPTTPATPHTPANIGNLVWRDGAWVSPEAVNTDREVEELLANGLTAQEAA